ncbi:MAG TPA: type II secretion system protein GspM [Longimicrobium sp.]|nr:type II secretion system protein GspM [Longimicrobium sp.]
MSVAVSDRERRTLVLGAVAVMLVLFLGRGLPAWRRWDTDARARAAEMTAEANEAEVAVRVLPALRDSAAARQARLVALAPTLLDGESVAAGGAALASLVSGAAAKAGVRVGAVQPSAVDSASVSVFARVRVRADATGDLPGLLRLLAALEGGPELLVLRDWSVTQGSAGGPAEQPESLRMEFTVEGLVLPRARGERR